MIKFLGMAVMAVLIVGCGDYQGDTSRSYVGDSTDNSVDNSVNYICTDNNDTSCYNEEYTLYRDENGSISGVADEPTGDYDPTYNVRECAINGYFWCSIEQKCLNQPAAGSSCSK